ncbi:MAG: ABC transporter permease [Anaerolineaceae bacterium]|nr:ABC transporter permease [Anaerolineaceae bacterium]
MKLLDLLRMILDNLNRRKSRVALTAVGVVIGTASVVLLISFANGMQQNTANQIGNMGDLTTIFVYPGAPMEVGARSGGGGMGAPLEKPLNNEAIEQISTLPGVSQIIPRVDLMGGSMIKFGKLEAWASVVGLPIQDASVLGYTAKEGTTQLERGTAILGGWAVKNFYDPSMRPGQEPPPPPDLAGQQVRVVIFKYSEDGQEIRKTYSFRIVGVLAETQAEADSWLLVRMDDLIPMNEWATGQRANYKRNGYHQLIVKADGVDTVVELTKQITEMGYMAWTPQGIVQGMNSLFTIIQVIFGGIGAIALLVAAIGIANTMTMAILERTREIGLMKAIGASNRDVLSIFLGEAAGIGLVGGLGGVLFGWGGGKMLNLVLLQTLTTQAAENGGLPPTVVVYTPAWLPFFAVLFAAAIGLLSGLYPALRAATLEPVTALKYE